MRRPWVVHPAVQSPPSATLSGSEATPEVVLGRWAAVGLVLESTAAAELASVEQRRARAPRLLHLKHLRSDPRATRMSNFGTCPPCSADCNTSADHKAIYGYPM